MPEIISPAPSSHPFNLHNRKGAAGKGKREIEPSFRILASPEIIDTVKAAMVTAYPLLIFQHPTRITLDTIPIATVETTEKIKQLYPFYTRIALGSKLMPLGEFYYNSTRSRVYHYGAHIKHLSSFGNIKRGDIVFPNGQFDHTDVLLFGKINYYRIFKYLFSNFFG